MNGKNYGIEIIDVNTAVIVWDDGKSMSIALNEGDADLIREGADPVADGWEDGCGNLVCYENAKEAEE